MLQQVPIKHVFFHIFTKFHQIMLEWNLLQSGISITYFFYISFFFSHPLVLQYMQSYAFNKSPMQVKIVIIFSINTFLLTILLKKDKWLTKQGSQDFSASYRLKANYNMKS